MGCKYTVKAEPAYCEKKNPDVVVNACNPSCSQGKVGGLRSEAGPNLKDN
jgi:hypothetical protein